MRVLHEKDFFDYGTEDINGNDVISLKTTGMSFYNDFLNPKETKYLKDNKNLIGTVKELSPNEYYSICAKDVFNTSVDSLKRQRQAGKDSISMITDVIKDSGKRLPMPFINLADKGQEGLHRMMVLGDMFGWDKKFPVLIVDFADKERAKKEKEYKYKRDIENRVERAIKETSAYRYTSVDEIESQLSIEIEKQFKYSNIDIPNDVEVDIEEKEDYYSFIFLGKEYNIDKEDITMVDDIEIDDEELLDDSFISDMSPEEFDKYIRDTYLR